MSWKDWSYQKRGLIVGLVLAIIIMIIFIIGCYPHIQVLKISDSASLPSLQLPQPQVQVTFLEKLIYSIRVSVLDYGSWIYGMVIVIISFLSGLVIGKIKQKKEEINLNTDNFQ